MVQVAQDHPLFDSLTHRAIHERHIDTLPMSPMWFEVSQILMGGEVIPLCFNWESGSPIQLKPFSRVLHNRP